MPTFPQSPNTSPPDAGGIRPFVRISTREVPTVIMLAIRSRRNPIHLILTSNRNIVTAATSPNPIQLECQNKNIGKN